MNFERQKRLLERLLEKTRAGEISWEETGNADAFQVSFSNNSVEITSLSGYDCPDYQISIIDWAGRTTETFDNAELDRDGPHISGSWYSIMHELFISARRNVLKADEAIDSILSEIG